MPASYADEISITVPIPTPIPYGKGITSTLGPKGCFIQTRATEDERDRIKAAASLLGLSYAAFMRRVCNDAADAIIAYYQEKQAT